MSREPRLDTSCVPHQRYSYLETPIEMSLPRFRSQDTPAQLPSDSGADTSTNTITANPNPPPAPETPRPVSTLANEKRDLEQAIPSGSHPPSVHPALFAPYADNGGGPSQQSPQSPYHSPPHSPGPLPIKQHPQPISIAGSIAPDVNPLQTPRSPPSVRGTFGRIPGPDATVSDEAYPNHLPGQISHAEQEIKGGTWNSSFGDCSDVGTCCLGMLCPCVLYGKTQYRLSRKSRKEDPTDLLGYEICNGSCTAMTVLCGCQCFLAAVQHTRTRKAYKIEGDICTDCVRSTFCCCCSLIQDDREIRKREEARADAAQARGNALVSPYLPPGPMQYPPPPT